MAVTELDTINFDQLEPTEVVESGDQFLVRTNDNYTKRVTKATLIADEALARSNQDAIIQNNLDELVSDLAGNGVAKKGVANGLAELDENGTVPSSQLPSYVDDVIEGYYNPSDGKFYSSYTPTVSHDIWTDGTSFFDGDTAISTEPSGLAKDPEPLGVVRKRSNIFYQKVNDDWFKVTAFTDTGFTLEETAVESASIIKALNNATDINISYVEYEEGGYSGEITPENGKVYTDLRTRVTYRWGGTMYVIIASDLALGTTHQTAGFGDESRAAYNHSLVRGTGDVSEHNPHGLSKTDIGLSEVPNVTTNNQTPTYTEAVEDAELVSGETLTTAFGKLAKIVKSVISHIGNRNNPHEVTKAQVGLGNVLNLSTDTAITSGSGNNITSGAVYTALTKKLDVNGTAINATYATKIGVDSVHPAIGSNKLPVYVDSAGDVKPITSLDVPAIQGNVEFTGKPNFDDDVSFDKSIEVGDNARFAKDVSIIGNLYVSGVTTAVEQESAITSDYLITRLNNNNGLAQGSHSGLAINNYNNGKMATITADHEGTWRIANSATNTSTVYTNIALFNNVYYTGLTHTETTGPTHIITNRRYLTLEDTVWYDDHYYHYASLEWKRVNSVTNGEFVFGDVITDAGLIETLEALTKYTLTYYITVTDNYIDENQNQPILTRDEEANMTGDALTRWDDNAKCAKTIPLPTMNNQALTAQVTGSNAVTVLVNHKGDCLNFSTLQPVTEPQRAYESEVEVQGTLDYRNDPTMLLYTDGKLYRVLIYAMKVYLVNSIEEYEPGAYRIGNTTTITGDLAEELLNYGDMHQDKLTRIYVRKYAAIPITISYQWKSNVGGGGLSFVGTRAQYEVAKLIPEGQDGYIPPNTLVTITDEKDFLKGDER